MAGRGDNYPKPGIVPGQGDYFTEIRYVDIVQKER